MDVDDRGGIDGNMVANHDDETAVMTTKQDAGGEDEGERESYRKENLAQVVPGQSVSSSASLGSSLAG
jgi:hypothetical protein